MHFMLRMLLGMSTCCETCALMGSHRYVSWPLTTALLPPPSSPAHAKHLPRLPILYLAHTQSVKKGIAHSQHEFGGVCGMQVLNFLSAPELLNMRLVYGDSLNGGGLTTQPTHVQLSARLATRQLPVFEQPAAQHGHSGHAAAAPGKKGAPQVSMKVKKLRGGTAKRANAAAVAAAASASPSAASTEALPAAGMVGHWLSAVDHASGREYFYNDTTGKSTWAIPPTLGTLSHIAWEPETGTQALEPLPDDTTADGQQLYRAESVVTWERAFGTGKGGWRIAGIM